MRETRRKFVRDSFVLGAFGIFVPRLIRGQIMTLNDPVFLGNQTKASGGGSSTLLNGLQAYYALSGLTDATGNGNTLTNHGTTTFVAGKVGNCANFVSASSQYLAIATNTYFQMGTSDFSFAFWFKTTTSSNEFMMTYGNTGSTGWGIQINGGNCVLYVSDNSHFDTVNIGGTWNGGAWHLLVATIARAGNEVVYVDNTSEATHATAATGSVNNAGGFNIGSWNSGGGNFFDGNIDEFGLWNRVLTSTEISHLYNGGSGTTYPFTGL